MQMLTPLLPVITKGEAKTNLFPWFMYPPVETFVARTQAETVSRTATFFLPSKSPHWSLGLHAPSQAYIPMACTMPQVCKSLMPLPAHIQKIRNFSRIFRE
ncbi:hypothetical protein FEK48_20065 [Escherichia sp. E2593]|nr:hypothetical protein D9740_15590 [Escherichia sp. E14V5]RZN06114.1 hypothetical protein D9741_02575 [Escherichia sp. E14V7]RZN18773.1 hypothetical protein D9734_17360 [Escherichia sp. E14S1]RZN24321.1 hypothetical protein D9739_19595 [Escherichia sp. E14V10]RZN38698.1 hypothetical protein D9738_20180 [Escherichia sp. E10V5]TBR67087.1 hypothetical protein D9737_13525 [Escherichia sp. E10V4]TGB56787.1 hypothetical protein CRT22_13400 [Escherichia sp. E5028]TGB66584.1 hypothetical protein CR